jgi:hypothetical protein
MLEYIPQYGGPAEHWGLLPATRLANRETLIEQNIKKRTGPSLCVLGGAVKLQYVYGPWINMSKRVPNQI